MIRLAGLERGGTIGINIFFKIDGQAAGSMHTSFSIPLYSGMTFGDFKIIRASSKNGGIICDTP
ncbi:MAG: hypothetical protein ACJATA_000628 [Sphingobacteriales bacterium]|jgi:hypothetical protein